MKQHAKSSDTSQLRLQTWMSAAFPLGAYCYSHGLESAIHDGRLTTSAECNRWIRLLLQHGSIWNDAVILSLSYRTCQRDRQASCARADGSQLTLESLNDLTLALCSGAERLRETTELGESFLHAAACWPDTESVSLPKLRQAITFPVALGMVSSRHTIPLHSVLASFLLATYSNLLWIAARLIPLGQSDTLGYIAAVESFCGNLADDLPLITIDALGTMAWCADLASLQHEQLRGRVCIT